MDILDKVKAIVAEKLGVEADKVTPEARFIEDLDADSRHIAKLEKVGYVRIEKGYAN